ncbi:uncharacterized protein [Periplaneta americana]|uniref:uncharacterized protein n=1 Tax=Periplaneta americana TaxID=6978 RepID=UPI0037E933A0
MASFQLATLVLAVFLLYRKFSVVNAGCTIPMANLNDTSPLILLHSPRKGDSPFYMPKNPASGSLSFRSGQSVRFACPDADNNLLLIPKSTFRVYDVIAQCRKGSEFSINSLPYDFYSLRCIRPPQPKIKEEGSCDIGQGKKYNIGFNLKRKFFGLIEICYDTRNQSALNARYILSKTVPSLEENKILARVDHTTTPTDVYSCKSQAKYVAGILGSQNQVKQFIKCDYGRLQYLAKHHLVPASDFLFEYQKKATSYYINTVPQWESISSGNWRILEDRIRVFANKQKSDLTIVSGTLDVTSLPDVKGVERKLYLNRDKKGNVIVPVPALFWKLVLNHNKNSGIVFIGVNNPYHRDLFRLGFIICTNICGNTVSWFSGWNRMDLSQGFIYCCAVNDFKLKAGIYPFPYSAKYLLS